MEKTKLYLKLHLNENNTSSLNQNTHIIKNNIITQLSDASQLSKQQIKQAMTKGAVWLTRGKRTQRLRRASKQAQNGDIVHLYYDEKILSEAPTAAQLIADEQAYSIWYKPYGMYCQGSKWGDHCTINRWVEKNLQRPTYIVHRLDRAATGLMIVAHKKTSVVALTALFQARKLEKHYRARVHGLFPYTAQPTVLNNDIDGRTAVSYVNTIAQLKERNQSIVEIKIDTGRKHQIRRHLSEINYPIVGERLYANSKENRDLQLCSWSLVFYCPIQQQQKQFDLFNSTIADTHNYTTTDNNIL